MSIMDVQKHWIIAWLLIITVLCHQHITVGLDLSSYETASFSINPSSEFTHFMTHIETGIVYIGAIDALYQLDANLVRQEVNNTAVQCEDDVQICPNYNKILLIDYAHDRLLTCGNENQGKCQARDLSNINIVFSESINPVVSPGISSTEGTIAPGPKGSDVLYLSTGLDEDRNNHVFLLSRRSLNTTDKLLFTVDMNDQILFTETNEFTINYAGAFQWNEFTYFVTSQAKDSVGEEQDIYLSKINRACQNSQQLDDSYAEILIECRSGDIRYNLIQAAYVGPAGADLAAALNISVEDDVFYGVFAKNEGEPLSSPIPSYESALCVFKLQDIEEAFIDVIYGCISRGNDFKIGYIHGSECAGYGEAVPRETAMLQQCTGHDWQIASGIEPLVSTAAIEWPDTIPSSVITATHRDHTVAFVGTMDGELVKVHIENATSAREYERFNLGGGPVLRDAELDSNKDMLTVLMQQKLVKLKVFNCGAYTTCDECIGTNGGQDGDPYCGWCTLERRCTLYDECPMADESTRWLPYNSAQCVSIIGVAPYDRYPITSTEQEITLTIEQLPDLDSGSSYQCIFDDIPAVPATKDGNMLTCITPAGSDILELPMGSDHVTMQLFVYSSETQENIVQKDFYFYDCDTHKGCIACTNSSWACDWCIYGNRCTHDNGMCSMEDDVITGKNNSAMSGRHGPEECPQLVAQEGEILIPVGVSRSITVTGMNLPEEDRVENYMCVLNIEDTEVSIAATRSGDMITCESRMYTYSSTQVQELDVRMAVIWNDNNNLDDEHGFTVTLFKCEVERPDCSRCLSYITARLELMCGWCGTNGMCTVNERCNGDWMALDSDGKCPAPTLSRVWPSSGPLEGGTVISVMGKDLGITFDDVQVTVGDKKCDTTGLREEYMVGSSVSCRTPPGIVDSEADICVTIKGPDGSSHQSTGRVIFTYRNPSISSIMPQEGPEAGGTVVTIRGQYLDACSNISATIGSQCIMNRQDNVLNETTATCRTTSSSIDSAFPLVVSFDGAARQSQDIYTYRPNPTVEDIQPKKTILSGGITLTVTGLGFNLAQTPQMAIYVDNEEYTEDCKILNDTMMLCKTPNIKTASDTPSRRKRQAGTSGEASFGFIIGDVSDLLTWSEDNNVTMEYFPDPVYNRFEENPVGAKGGSIKEITGQNLDAGSTKDDVTVYIGTVPAMITGVGESVLTIRLPLTDPGRRCIDSNTTQFTCVVVYHGNLPPFYVGLFDYPSEVIEESVIIAVSTVCVLLVLGLLLLLILYRCKVKGHQENIDKLLLEMEELENNIGADIHEAFGRLQTDMTDLTSDLEGTGMPFVELKQYAISMFFTGLEVQPLSYESQDCDESEENAMLELSKLLSNKKFLTALIEILDGDKCIPNKDRLSIASLLTVLMISEEQLHYLTDVMLACMTRQVEDAIEANTPNRLFQRTELIMERLMSNWIALILYDFLKNQAAYPLFLMYRAIKCQTEKGPIDMVTGKSYLSLSDDNIIQEKVTFQELTLEVLLNEEDGEKKEVVVLDTDSIGLVKMKILDAIHRNKLYSERTQPLDVHLELHSGRAGHLILQDIDGASGTESGWKRVNTLQHFNVQSGATVTLPSKEERPTSTTGDQADVTCSSETQVKDGVQLWHLVKEDTDESETTVKRKQIPEVSFTRLLGMKGTVQEYMDKMFAVILNTGDVPIGIKYIFDIFDSLAARNNIEDESVLHKWKSNILPLRFWQRIITNPQYIFDIGQSQCVEASLSVISQAFYDAFRFSNEQLGKDTPYRRLLYSREIPRYRVMVKDYYSSVSQMQEVNKGALDQDLKDICVNFKGVFSRISTLMELFKFMVKYKNKLRDAFANDPQYEEAGLSDKFLHVFQLMPAKEPEHTYQQDISLQEEQ